MDSLIIFGAKYLIFLIGLAALILAFYRFRANRWQLIASIIVAAILSYILAKIAGKFYYHPRPFVVEHIKPLVAHASDNGFPSDHTTGAAAIATILYMYDKKIGLTFFTLAIVVGLCRIGAHIHSPVDIIGGLLLGILAGWCGWKLIEIYSAKNQSTQKR